MNFAFLWLLVFLNLFFLSQPVFAGNLDFSGELAINYRLIGGKPAEVEIENQLHLSDGFFSVTKSHDGKIPLVFEVTTDFQSQLVIHQLYADNIRWQGIQFTFGKFLVPFGRTNELDKPSDFPYITRPLPYASPKSLDYVARLNFPQPFMAAGFSDLGVKGTWRPMSNKIWIPSEITVFVTNGMQESPFLGRGYPRSEVLGEPDQQKGVFPDFGHEVNNIADNNDTKQIGGRLRFQKNKLEIGTSALFSKYDVEDVLDYAVAGVDFQVPIGKLFLNGELLGGYNDYRIAKSVDQALSKPKPEHLAHYRQYQWGYDLSSTFPLRRWFYGKENQGYLGVSYLSRRGKEMLFEYAENISYQPVDAPQATYWMNKYTLGVNSELKEDLYFKIEYSYWLMSEDWRFRAKNMNQLAISSIIRF